MRYREALDILPLRWPEVWKEIRRRLSEVGASRVTGPVAIAQAQKEADTSMDHIDDLQMY